MSKLDLNKVSHRNPHLSKDLIKGKLVVQKSTKGDVEKQYILNTLMEFCNTELTLHLEYKFSDRKFRFDYYIEELNLAIEYEGIFSTKSRHTTKEGYSKDTEKYNLATLKRIHILRYTANTYQNLKQDLITFITNNNELR